MTALTRIDLGVAPIKQGKVRSLYEANGRLLLVATDRLSAFDHVFAEGIPYKGQVLTGISRYWFEQTAAQIPNHLLSVELPDFPPEFQRQELAGRAMLVQKTKALPVECIVRGYLDGSGWKDYQKTGAICGQRLPEKLRQGDRLPEPLFTPSTKAEAGHDENISEARMFGLLGRELGEAVKQKSLDLYRLAARDALGKGIIIADTKFEFGLADDGRLLLIDEALTPDSSRFWDIKFYQPGQSQQSFDKQFVRDYLERSGWNKEPPVPALPAEIVQKTSAKYLEAYRRLTGRKV
ncbi:phosphoribosylaminoimidazolesuccinocarboxamide synthase [Candidatus Termititenax persephonae]|uniref:Phosphoribosylaminoimidazole-succinocarboxamide synthase n=1 Tax=Candidatus Termititenax persephonae TaxID=2218525 RepID=A0A388TGW2_9BACT|nr:phosphoribosylaminoimidazolesuccinocarboxamide synthase [Candidatus Termititenax persephonae]